MHKEMKKIISIICFLGFLSCSKDSKKENSFITIVFKNPNIKDTLFYDEKMFAVNENQITYSIENEFIENKIDIKNTDTIVKIKTSKPIFLNHLYYISDFNNNSYCFFPNDTLIFEYKNGVPFVKSTLHKKYNYNFNSFFNIKYPSNFDENLFYKKFKRFKNDIERENDQKARIIREKKQIIFFDSLKDKKLINTIDYKLNLSHIENKVKLKKYSPLKILKREYNLADSGNTFLVINAFENIYNLKFISVSDGRLPNYKKQFEHALDSKNINFNNRKYLMFYYLNNLASRGNKLDFIECFKKFDVEFKDKKIITFLKKKYPLIFEANRNSNRINEVLLLDKNKKEITLNEILKKCKGKVVYVDFWASWCMPCRELMPNSQILHEEYKNKNIEFVYISIDDDFIKWKKTMKKDKISNHIHNYITINYPRANLYRELELKTIPRFLIYDKYGNLVNRNAPNPKSKDIKAELEKLLK